MPAKASSKVNKKKRSIKFKTTINEAFTLIELLIVIAIVAIIAIAVLAALNPLEQLGRSTDTSYTSDSQQISTAIERYSTNQRIYPWMADETDSAAINFEDVTDPAITGPDCDNDSTAESMLEVLDECSGELRQALVTRIGSADYDPLYVYRNSNVNGSVYLCFAPHSERFENEARLKCDANLADYPPSACGNTSLCGAKGNCFCIP